MKKSSIIKIILASLFCCFILSSCYEDYTHFYEDPENPGLSIFSDKANNIMTCYVDNTPWRTYDRTSGGFSPPSYEVYINRLITTGTTDTLIISWGGDISGNPNNGLDVISLILPIPKFFTYKDFNNLQGKRITIDTTNGYFTNTRFSLSNNIKGTGNIYFHFAELHLTATNFYYGRLSGIFEANIGSYKITKGRFDHAIDPEQVSF